MTEAARTPLKIVIAVRVAAYGLALVVVGAAARAWLHEEVMREEMQLLVGLTDALLARQGPDGVFDPMPDDPEAYEVLRTGPHALAAAALARARETGAGRWVPELDERLAAALDVLVERQRPGGGFGGMPPGRANPWPAVEATASAALALATAGRAFDRPVLRGALASLERTAAYPVRDGWTRSLVALSLHEADDRGAGALVGRDLGTLVALGRAEEDPVCDEMALAEAIVRRVRRPEDPMAAVGRACAADPPFWGGERSDLRAWWLQAWLAVRTGDGEILEAVREALGEALATPPVGTIPGGWFADDITQLACAVLASAEILESDAPHATGR